MQPFLRDAVRRQSLGGVLKCVDTLVLSIHCLRSCGEIL